MLNPNVHTNEQRPSLITIIKNALTLNFARFARTEIRQHTLKNSQSQNAGRTRSSHDSNTPGV